MRFSSIKSFGKALFRRLSSGEGSVALEYILLLVFCVGAYECWLELFEPGVGFTKYGQEFTAFFQRILIGISLPVP